MNTLTALAGWIEESPRTAVRMVDALADEFRTLVDVSGRALIPLEDELALCRAHLEVMGFRRDQAFVLDARLDPDSPAVPPAVLHTLIEDRKSVVRGKRVSVRVDIGGRRIIKTNKIDKHDED